MSLVAGDLITAARKRAFGSRGKQKISDSALLEELSYQDQLLTQMFAQIVPDLLATISGAITLSDGSNANGYTLQPGIHYRDFTHIDSDGNPSEITILQRQHRDKQAMIPAAMLRLNGPAAVFYPIDPLGMRWSAAEGTREYFEASEGDTVRYSYVPLPSPLTSLSSTLTSPDMAREVLVTSLRLAILLSREDLSEMEIQAALAQRQGMMDALRMSAYKFHGPPGRRPNPQGRSELDWLEEQIV